MYSTYPKDYEANSPVRGFSEIDAPLSSIINLEVPTASLPAATTPHFIRRRATRCVSSVHSTADGTLCRYPLGSHTMNKHFLAPFGTRAIFLFSYYFKLFINVIPEQFLIFVFQDIACIFSVAVRIIFSFL